jgi:hypothetical protein
MGEEGYRKKKGENGRNKIRNTRYEIRNKWRSEISNDEWRVKK